jgi:putative copper resistance protein D
VVVPDPEFLVAPDPTDGDRAPAALGRPKLGPDQGGVILDTIAPVEKAPATTEADRAAGARRWRIGVLIATAALVTACVAVALAAIVPARALIQGLPDAGEFTQLALPAVTGLFNLMAAVTIGWLLGAAALAPPQKSGIVDVGGYRCLRAASLAAVVWAASGLALISLTVADALGRSLADAVEMNTLSTALSVSRRRARRSSRWA